MLYIHDHGNNSKEYIDHLKGNNIDSFWMIINDIENKFIGDPGSKAAFNLAIYDAYCKNLGISVGKFLGRKNWVRLFLCEILLQFSSYFLRLINGSLPTTCTRIIIFHQFGDLQSSTKYIETLVNHVFLHMFLSFR